MSKAILFCEKHNIKRIYRTDKKSLVCPLCRRDRRKELYRKKNPSSIILLEKICKVHLIKKTISGNILVCKECRKEYCKIRKSKIIENLSDAYMGYFFPGGAKKYPKDLVDLKRSTILLKRTIRNLKNANNQ